MKYDVTYSCGHEGVVELFGKNKERERKLKWYQSSAVCQECYQREQAKEMEEKGYQEIEMHYSEYKNKYSGCKTKSGSYDKRNKTIIVYVPVVKEEIQDEVVKTTKMDKNVLSKEEIISQYEMISDIVKEDLVSLKEKMEEKDKITRLIEKCELLKETFAEWIEKQYNNMNIGKMSVGQAAGWFAFSAPSYKIGDCGKAVLTLIDKKSSEILK